MILRPRFAVVHCSARAHPWQAAPNVTLPLPLIGRLIPAGQVRVRVAASWVKSSMVNPPSTTGLIGHGFNSGVHPLPLSVASMSPVA